MHAFCLVPITILTPPLLHFLCLSAKRTAVKTNGGQGMRARLAGKGLKQPVKKEPGTNGAGPSTSKAARKVRLGSRGGLPPGTALFRLMLNKPHNHAVQVPVVVPIRAKRRVRRGTVALR